ncbi:hypothetical protein [Streptomyces sp. NPDC017448]|uniref:hypothetical protein n=1 Tax=Streptomyces sp. NPDC017448 TaxID=3364996 RepID=UPI0037A630E9
MRRVCEFCGRGLAAAPVTGAPRRFCGEECRQAAHRRRLCAGPAATPAVRPAATPAVRPVAVPAVRSTATPAVRPVAVPAVRPPATPVRAPGRPAGRTPPRRPAPPAPSADAVAELARRVREQAHDLVRRLPTADDAEALRRVAQLREQLDGLTAAVVGRACRGPVR